MISANELIRPVLESLPVLPDRKMTLDSECSFLAAKAVMGHMNSLPVTEAKGTAAGLRELEALAKHGWYFAKHFSEMHRDSSEALDASLVAGDPAIRRFKHDLIKMVKAIYRARGSIAAGEFIPAPDGRPRKKLAAELTEAAAGTFERLTGQDATVSVDPNSSKAYGPFLEFLTKLFGALGIGASAESQARAFKEKSGRKEVTKLL